MASAEEVPGHTSLERMLELEKKRKLERLQNRQPNQVALAAPARLTKRIFLQPQQADSYQNQQLADMMLKNPRRSLPVPSLSVTIPQEDREQTREISSGEQELVVGLREPAMGDPFQKQVKFDEADDEQDDFDDARSVESSICQSPSWEGYGQKKRVKKEEMERKKKEKEDADRAAKAARKKPAARLSKKPPQSRRSTSMMFLADPERSMSDPTLTSRRLLSMNGSSCTVGDAKGDQNDVGLRPKAFTSASAEAITVARPTGLSQARSSLSQTAFQSASDDHLIRDHGHSPRAAEENPRTRKTTSIGPGVAVTASPIRDVRSSRDACPPSASRTPMLRNHEPRKPRRNSFLQNATKMFRGRESRSRSVTPDCLGSNNLQESVHDAVDKDKGRSDDGYVRQQRGQSTERAMASLADAQLIGGLAKPARRQSFTQEAKSFAKRLARLESSPVSAVEETHTDSVGNVAETFSMPGLELPNPTRQNGPAFPENEKGSKSPRENKQALKYTETPAQKLDTAPEPSSFSTKSPTGGKKRLGFKDAAKVALQVGKATWPGTGPKSAETVPVLTPAPTPLVQALWETTEATNKRPTPLAQALPETTEAAKRRSAQVPEPFTNGGKQDISAQSFSTPARFDKTGQGARVSEGSASSLAYDDDGSPLPSPTTANTSRPQSSGSVSVDPEDTPKPTTPPLNVQDYDRTEPSHSQPTQESSGMKGPIGPGLQVTGSDQGHGTTVGSTWSRAALPHDGDFDAQSFVTSLSNQDNTEGTDGGIFEAQLLLPMAVTSDDARPASHMRRSEPPPVQALSGSPEDINTSLRLSRRRQTHDGCETVISYVEEEQEPRGSNSDPKQRRRQKSCETGKSVQRAIDEARVSKQETRRSLTPTAHDVLDDRTVTGNGLSKGRTFADMILQSSHENIPDNDWHQLSTATRGKGAALDPNASRDHLTKGSRTSPMSSVLQSADFFHDLDEENRAEPIDTDIREQLAGIVFPSPPSGAKAPNLSLPGSTWSSQSGLQSKGQHRLSRGPGVSQSRASSGPKRKSAPTGSKVKQRSARSPSPPEPSSKSAGAPPVPQPAAQTGPQTLSALPKHMQLQAGMSVRASTVPKVVAQPLAKMFVECCNCKFYHDLPSKVYECMAKPDAVIEDRILGISGAITTAVKCPWCEHSMSTKCCAGYAALVYITEKLH